MFVFGFARTCDWSDMVLFASLIGFVIALVLLWFCHSKTALSYFNSFKKKASKFFILSDVIFRVRLRGKFEIDPLRSERLKFAQPSVLKYSLLNAMFDDCTAKRVPY